MAKIGQPSDLNCPTKHLLQKSIYPTFGHKLSESIEKIFELFPVITQFIFTIQYALVSLGKDFLVLELQWVIEFTKITRPFYKTLSHIYSKKYPRRTETEKKKTGFIVPGKKNPGLGICRNVK